MRNKTSEDNLYFDEIGQLSFFVISNSHSIRSEYSSKLTMLGFKNVEVCSPSNLPSSESLNGACVVLDYFEQKQSHFEALLCLKNISSAFQLITTTSADNILKQVIYSFRSAVNSPQHISANN